MNRDDDRNQLGGKQGASDSAQLAKMITAVERDPRQPQRYRIYVDHQLACTVHEDVLVKYRLLKGAQVMDDELRDIMAADELQQAYLQGIRYLQRKPRTRHEVLIRLTQKGYEGEIIEQALQRLAYEKLLDDAVYAKQWAEQRVRSHKKGRLWVKHELQQKGVDKEKIIDAMEQIDGDQELQSAIAVGLRKWQNTKGNAQERRQKTMAFLMRRGYPGEIVRKALQEIQIQSNEASESEEFQGEEDLYFD